MVHGIFAGSIIYAVDLNDHRFYSLCSNGLEQRNVHINLHSCLIVLGDFYVQCLNCWLYFWTPTMCDNNLSGWHMANIGNEILKQ